MTLEQAFNNLKQVAENYPGKWQEHLALQESLNTILELINSRKEPVEKTN